MYRKPLYVIAESASGMHQRVQAWEASAGIATEGRVKFIADAVQLADANHVDVQAMRTVIDALNPGVIFVDTQARATVGVEENSSRDMGKFVDALERLREPTGVLFVTVHHEPRNGENPRGSVALEGAATSILRSVKDGENVQVECLKQKDVEEPDKIMLTLYQVGQSAVLMDGVPGASQQLGVNHQKILDTVMEAPGFEMGPTAITAITKLSSTEPRSDQGNYHRYHLAITLPPNLLSLSPPLEKLRGDSDRWTDSTRPGRRVLDR